MRDPARIARIMEKLGTLWARYPDWRFCQLIENLILGAYPNHTCHCIFHIEDDEFERILDHRLKEGFK